MWELKLKYIIFSLNGPWTDIEAAVVRYQPCVGMLPHPFAFRRFNRNFKPTVLPSFFQKCNNNIDKKIISICLSVLHSTRGQLLCYRVHTDKKRKWEFILKNKKIILRTLQLLYNPGIPLKRNRKLQKTKDSRVCLRWNVSLSGCHFQCSSQVLPSRLPHIRSIPKQT